MTLRRDGIRIHRQDLLWQLLDHYYVANGHVVFYPVGARHIHDDAHSFLLEDVPNYWVLLQLLVELGKHPTSAEASQRLVLGR